MQRSRFTRTLIVIALLLSTTLPALGATAAPPPSQTSWAVVDWIVDWFTGLDEIEKVTSKSISLDTGTEDDSPAPEPSQTFAIPYADSISSDSEVQPQNDPDG